VGHCRGPSREHAGRDPRELWTPRAIDHLPAGRTIAPLRRRIEYAADEGRTAEEIAVLVLLRSGLEDRARPAG
jgi:hypothetical protein